MADGDPTNSKGPGVIRKFQTFVFQEITSNPFQILGSVCFVIIAVFLFKDKGDFIKSLQDSDTARGLITFLVAVTTVCIAILGAIFAMSGSKDKPEEVKERFGFIREILALLISVLGTVLGFYFGSSDKAPHQSLALSDIKIKASYLYTYVSGGDAPYKCSLRYISHHQERINIPCEDGWISDSLKYSLKPGESIILEVSDSKGVKVSREYEEKSSLPSLGKRDSIAISEAKKDTGVIKSDTALRK